MVALSSRPQCVNASQLSLLAVTHPVFQSTRHIMWQTAFILYIILLLIDFLIHIVFQKKMNINLITLDLFWISIVLEINKSFVLTANLAKSPQNWQHRYWWAFVNARHQTVVKIIEKAPDSKSIHLEACHTAETDVANTVIKSVESTLLLA